MLRNHVFSRRVAFFAVATGFVVGWLLSAADFASAQTVAPANGSTQQAIIKIEESTHLLTPEDQEAKQVIISKVYDTQDPLGNSYLLRVNGNNKAVVIDPGYNYEAIIKYMGQLNVDLEAILLTNGGFLRIAGNEELRKKWPNATILVGDSDAGLLTDPKANMSSEFGGVKSPIANVWLKDGDAFELAGLPIAVVGTPGFTPGSMTYVLATDDAAIAFTGDFIYKEGISSANMPSSDEAELHKSLDHFIETQFAETLVFPGHGENTSVAEFYQQMTGKSISVIADDNSSTSTDGSPIIIVERDPATVVVTQQQVYVPTIEYRTETIVVERYVRPWVSVGVGIPLWSSWYRPWYDYYSYRPYPVVPIYLYYGSPYWRTPYYSSYYGHGYYPPPLVVPSLPGVLPPPKGGMGPGGFPPKGGGMGSGGFPPKGGGVVSVNPPSTGGGKGFPPKGGMVSGDFPSKGGIVTPGGLQQKGGSVTPGGLQQKGGSVTPVSPQPKGGIVTPGGLQQKGGGVTPGGLQQKGGNVTPVSPQPKGGNVTPVSPQPKGGNVTPGGLQQKGSGGVSVSPPRGGIVTPGGLQQKGGGVTPVSPQPKGGGGVSVSPQPKGGGGVSGGLQQKGGGMGSQPAMQTSVVQEKANFATESGRSRGGGAVQSPRQVSPRIDSAAESNGSGGGGGGRRSR